MLDLDVMSELDHAANIRKLMAKLPFGLRSKWRSLVDSTEEQEGRVAGFADFVNFVERQARIMSNPVYGQITSERDSAKGKATFKGNDRKKGVASFATTVEDKKEYRTEVDKTEVSEKTGDSCLYCNNQSHSLAVCRKLEKKPMEDRIKFLRSKGLCFGCLKRASHLCKDCNRKLTCGTCSKKHPTVLHREMKTNETDQTKPKVDKPTESSTCGLTGAGGGEYRPAIIPVIVHARETGQSVMTYAFLDDGSDAIFCTEKLRCQLNVKGKKSKLQVQTITEDKLVESMVIRGLQISDMEQRNTMSLPEVFTQEKIPASKEDAVVMEDIQRWSYVANVVQLPDGIKKPDAHVGLLIGNSAPRLVEPLRVINSQNDGPYACQTVLGWAIYGLPKKPSSPTSDVVPSVSAHRIMVKSDLEQQFKNMYNQDFNERTIDDIPQRSREDQKFMALAEETIRRADGHYELGLPLRNQELEFPVNRTLAEHRASHLKAKFKRSPEFQEEYVAAMKKTIDKGYAEAVPEKEIKRDDGKLWYIPHHGVYHPQKHKLRVVFDCAAVCRGVSLNKELYQGPDLTNSLVGVLLRFREEPVAVIADIEGMFNQVRVPSQDRDLLRFLWWPNGDTSQPMKEFRMKTHLFGASSSPSCANFALRRTADDTEELYGKLVADTIRDNFYVDDCLRSIETEEQAISLVKGLDSALKYGGFRLTKWVSNRHSVINSVPIEDRASGVESLDLQDSLPVQRALGVLWFPETDTFGFKISLKGHRITRRGILSTVSSIYDPLGFVAPAILPAKQILQDLCKLKLDWDDDLPVEHQTRWHEWTSELHKLEEFTINRCMKPPRFEHPEIVQIHHFSDASDHGYGTASYLRVVNGSGEVCCQLIVAKSRVAPVKRVTIPRMELTAATVAVKVDAMLRRELGIDAKSYFWTDSSVVLCYVKNETTRFHTFVANRIAIIREGSQPEQWRYVDTANNPADDCSRGLSATSLLQSTRWVRGPEFLWKDPVNWPVLNQSWGDLQGDDLEVKSVSAYRQQVRETSETLDKLIEYYSSWYSLKKAVAYILKVKKILLHRARMGVENVSRGGDHPAQEPIADKIKSHDGQSSSHVKTQQQQDEQLAGTPLVTVDDMREAEQAIVCYVQERQFPKEIATLQKGEIPNKSSSLYRLDPKLEDGVLRVGGRLSKAALPEEVKHPVILPKDHHVTTLVLQSIHEMKGHSGRSHMLASLRQRYWVIGANAAARKIVNKCVVCRKQRGKVQQQKMADLPEERLTPSEPPFTKVGMNYFGPFAVKRGRSMVKRYGVIFTCMSIRAVHIEMADSLDTDSCINAIRRFVARRGQVTEIRSDNGTNIVGAEKALRAEIQNWNQSKIHESLLQRNIKWVFNPPAGSHFGGIWERQIRSIRKVMFSVLKEQTLTDESLRTLFCEVEAIINDRPITKGSSDVNDLEALTPNHLLLMKTKPMLPPTLTSPTDKYTRRWRQVQYLSDLFWKRWIKEYLPELQERQRWLQVNRNAQVGDLVLVVDNSTPRGSWPMARVVKTMPDGHGQVRSVQVKTKTGIIIRPISKLVLLLEGEE